MTKEKKKLFKDFPKNKIDGINFKKISIFEGRKKNSQGSPRIKGFIFQKRISNFKIKMMKRKFFKGPQKLMVFPFVEEIQVLKQNKKGEKEEEENCTS